MYDGKKIETNYKLPPPEQQNIKHKTLKFMQ